MAYKDILVYLDPTPPADDRLKVAVGLAQTHGARLFGVDASTDEAYLGPWERHALEIGPKFEAAIRAAGVVGQYHASGDRKPAQIADLPHCVDLVIAPRPEDEARALVRSFVPEQVLLTSGAPVLVLPQYWKLGPVGENIVVAWNASREAARAVHDALPLLEKASKVTLFAFSSAGNGLRASAETLADHLQRHGVTAQISDWADTGDVSAVEALFASLDTQDADLIVAGAYGHSRAFESLFGGVSLDLLKQPTMPLLMSH